LSQHRSGRIRPVASLLSLTLTSGTLAGLGILAAAPAGATPTPGCVQPTQTYAAGAQGSYVVPAGATTVDVVASGAAAVTSQFQGQGGVGATVATTLSVTPGEVLDYTVGTPGDGRNGGLSGTSPSGGYAYPYYSYQLGSGGGGATFVTSGGSVLVAAGGGGGGGDGLAGGDAAPSSVTTASGVFSGGNPQTQNGDAPATGGSTVPGLGAPAGAYYGSGSAGSGQVGGNSAPGAGGGGGGGGYFGGGGGAFGGYWPNGGGAGSSYAVSDYTIVANGSAGSLTISAPADPVFQSANSTTFIEGQNSPFTVCAPGGPGTTIGVDGTLPAGVTFTDNGDGTATLSGSATVAGTFPLTITSTSSVATETQNFSLVVNDISAKTLVVTVDPASITAGGQVSGTVTAYDAQGDVATTDNDVLSMSSSDSMANVSQVFLSNGTGTFTADLYTAGSQTVTATDDATEGTIIGTSNDVDVAPAAATSLTVQLPASTTAGVGVQAVITAHDDWGNIDTNDNGTVNLASSDTDGTLQPTASLVAGTVTVPVTFVNAGNEFMTATDATDASITDQSETVVDPAATTRLDMGMPYVVVAGSTNDLNVQTLDAYGNATSTSDLVHFSSSDPRAVLPADAGMDTLSGSVPVTLKTAGGQTVTVTDVTNPDVTSSSWDVTVVPGAVQAVHTNAGDQQSVPAAHDFGSPLSALVVDANGNPVPGQQVVFSVLNGADSSFDGSATDLVFTDENGVATADVLTAGTTIGTLTVTAATNGQNQLLANGAHVAIANGSTSFTETITASDAAVSATPKTSTGVGTATQSATVNLPSGGSVSLLNANGDPVTMVVTADGTYVLDPSTGVISFVAVAGFSGTATPVGYRVTDAFHLQATSTYTPTVTAPAPVVPPTNPVTPPTAPPASHPLGVAHVRTASHVVLTGSRLSATCTVSVAALGTCRTSLTATVAGRQVVLGRSSTTKAGAGAKQVKTVIHLNALGRAMAAQVGGVKATAWASVTKTDGRGLSAKRSVTLVDQRVLVPGAVLFPTASTGLTAQAQRQLKALKTHLGGVKTVTCVGYADSVGNAATNVALGKARAKAVCAALAGHGVKLVLVTRGDQHPAGDNATAAGRTLNRRVELRLTY
jgi:CshA-type fibril repeat protein